MKITFIVPELNLTGGLRVVSIYARLLTEKGHVVHVVSPNYKRPTIKEYLKSIIKWRGYKLNTGFDASFFQDANYELKILPEHRSIVSDDVPDADVIIATYWTTAEWIATFPASKGKKFYFLQHFELHPWMPTERVLKTFHSDYKKIVVADWIAEAVSTATNRAVDAVVVPNGVDLQQFSYTKRLKQSEPTIGLMYSTRSYKGCDVAFKAIEKARSIVPNLKIIAFGTDMPVNDLPLPKNTTYFQKPDQSFIREIYAQCDAWLFTSSMEGFGLPILEANSCGTPVIGTKSGAAPYLITDSTGYLCEINDVQQIAEAIISIANLDDTVWLTLSKNARLIAEKNSWQHAVDKFEQALDS